MNILLISSSPRKEKSQTYLLAKEVLRGLSDKDVKSEVVHLCDFNIGFCRHLERCHEKIMDCPIRDDAGKILKKMLEADGIILASPNYINQVTASMKALFDRSSHFIHCKRLLDKYVAAVVSSGSGYDKDVLDYLKHYANACGAQYSGGVSARSPAGKAEREKAFELGKRLASDIEMKKVYPDQAEAIEESRRNFARVMEMRKKDWPQEYKYWLDKGWL